MKENKRRSTLLVGNGINRSFGEISWEDMLKKIAKRHQDDIKDINCPMPLKAVLITEDTIDVSIKNIKSDLYGKLDDVEKKEFIKKWILSALDIK